MKLYIDTNLLCDHIFQGASDSEDIGILKKLIDNSDHSFWISANSIGKVTSRMSGPKNTKDACDFLPDKLEHFSIIPLRKSILIKALGNRKLDLDTAIEIYSAQGMNMDCIITRRPEKFALSDLAVYTPSQLYDHLAKPDLIIHVPFLDLKAQHHQIFNDIEDRFTDIIANTGFIMGKYVEEFEKAFSHCHDARFCVGVSSGTDALHVALMSLGIGRGDLVIVPANTFIATAEPLTLCGAEPVFVDSDQYHHLDTDRVERLIERMNDNRRKRLKAIIPVHLFGQAADMENVMRLAEKYSLDVIEDACQAHFADYKGKKIGSMGKFGAFSFYPGKNLGAWGEAGALLTNDPDLYLKAKQFRQHGETQRYCHQLPGHNYRMSAFQGAALSVKVKFLSEWTRKRQENAKIYKKYLKDVPGIDLPREKKDSPSVYHLFVIQTDNRDALRNHLQKHGISSGLHYPVPLHLQPAYRSLGYDKGAFPFAEKAADRMLSLPMYPELTIDEIRYVCDHIVQWQTTL